MRTFNTGATRDSDDSKIDLDGFLSPLVIKRFGEYMHKHRKQADGALRPSDNWQKGIPLEAYRKSMCRHWFDIWALDRGYTTLSGSNDIEDELCALLFNVQGFLHERLKSSLKDESWDFRKEYQPSHHPALAEVLRFNDEKPRNCE